MVRDTFTLTLPADAPPGLYHLRVGWYDPATQTRLPVGEGDTLRLAVVPVNWEGTGEQSIRPLDARFDKAVALQGYAWQVDPEAVEVTLRWSADVPLDREGRGTSCPRCNLLAPILVLISVTLSD